MGETSFEGNGIVKAVASALHEVSQATVAMRLTTPGGRFHVRWDEGGSATALGQLASLPNSSKSPDCSPAGSKAVRRTTAAPTYRRW